MFDDPLVETMIEVVFVVLTTLSIGCAVYWLAVSFQIVQTNRLLPTARDGIGISEGRTPSERVCVVVPCHNEAGNIATLIGSLKEQDYERLRIVLALDRCTDDTIGVARRAIGEDQRFEIVEIAHCPDDWAGKVHAAHSGYEASEHARSADILLFTDADTWLDPACIRASVALLDDRGLDFLSLHSTLNSESWFERLVQPITAFELARQYPLTRVNLEDDRQRAFANGQFMMFTRGVYQAIEGHRGVREAILEDIAFARLVKKCSYRGGLLLADGMVRCRMYDGWGEYVRGWKRIYTESANREVKRLRRYGVRTPLLCSVLPLMSVGLVVASLIAGESGSGIGGVVVGGIGIVSWIMGIGLLHRMSKARMIDVPGALVGGVLTGWIFFAAARDLARGTPTRWGGRSYIRKAEDS